MTIMQNPVSSQQNTPSGECRLDHNPIETEKKPSQNKQLKEAAVKALQMRNAAVWWSQFGAVLQARDIFSDIFYDLP